MLFILLACGLWPDRTGFAVFCIGSLRQVRCTVSTRAAYLPAQSIYTTSARHATEV